MTDRFEVRRQSEEERIVNLVVSNTGKRLSPMETLSVANRLKNFKWTNNEVAQRLGLTPSYLQHLYMLKKATPTTLGYIREGKTSASTVIDALRARTRNVSKRACAEPSRAGCACRRRTACSKSDRSGRA